MKHYKNRTEIPFEKFINKDNKEFCTKEALDLLKRMFIYDHEQRITAHEALKHPFFDSIK